MSALQKSEILAPELEVNLARHLTAVPDYVAHHTVGEQACKQSAQLTSTYRDTTDSRERTAWLNQLSAEELRLLLCSNAASKVLVDEVYPVAQAYFVLDNIAHESLFRMCAEAQIQKYEYL